MKLHKQTGLKAAIAAAIAALMVALFGVIKSEPRINAEPEPAPVTPAPNYDQFFAPNPNATPVATPVERVAPHTRSRAS